MGQKRTGKELCLCKNCVDACCVLGSLVLGAVFGNVLLGVGLGTILSMIGVGRVIYLFNRAARVRPCAARPGWRTEPANRPWPGLAK